MDSTPTEGPGSCSNIPSLRAKSRIRHESAAARDHISRHLLGEFFQDSSAQSLSSLSSGSNLTAWASYWAGNTRPTMGKRIGEGADASRRDQIIGRNHFA